jgi:hypothetical protein
MRRVMLIQGMLTGSLVVATLVALLAGRILNLPPIALFMTGECQLPCWNNLHPGETNISEAGDILVSLGYTPRTFDPDPILRRTSFVAAEPNAICEVHLNPVAGGSFNSITLRACTWLPMGDILSLIGEPESMLPLASVIVFREGQMILFLNNRMCDQEHVSLHMPIRYIVLSDEGVNTLMLNQPSDLPWHGAIPLSRYSRLYPDKVFCPW